MLNLYMNEMLNTPAYADPCSKSSPDIECDRFYKAFVSRAGGKDLINSVIRILKVQLIIAGKNTRFKQNIRNMLAYNFDVS